MPTRGAFEGVFPLERAGDYSTDAVLALQNLAGDAAIFIQLFFGNDILMRCALKYAVEGGFGDTGVTEPVKLNFWQRFINFLLKLFGFDPKYGARFVKIG